MKLSYKPVATNFVGHLADGSAKPIEEIQSGDIVMSRDEATGKTEAKEVVRVFERQSNELVVITLANGEEIRTTPEHPFSVEGKGWTAARDLKSFDRLATTSSTSSSIDSVQWMRTPSKVYNFEVEDYHTYFVSANGTEVWVHNACTPPGPKGTGANSRANPNAEAIGAHTVFRRESSGRVEHYTTYAPPRSPKNPNAFVPQKRFDGVGRGHKVVPTPHVQLPRRTDGPLNGPVRPPRQWELPRGY
jgi:hypothetical protein